MGRLLFRSTLVLAATLLALAALSPWLLYELGLSHVGVLPEPPAALASADEQLRVWRHARAREAPQSRPLNPYGFVWKLWQLDEDRPADRVAYWVASRHNMRQPALRGLSWQLSNAALTIWLSRHWSPAELATAALPVVERDLEFRARRGQP